MADHPKTITIDLSKAFKQFTLGTVVTLGEVIDQIVQQLGKGAPVATPKEVQLAEISLKPKSEAKTVNQSAGQLLGVMNNPELGDNSSRYLVAAYALTKNADLIDESVAVDKRLERAKMELQGLSETPQEYQAQRPEELDALAYSIYTLQALPVDAPQEAIDASVQNFNQATDAYSQNVLGKGAAKGKQVTGGAVKKTGSAVSSALSRLANSTGILGKALSFIGGVAKNAGSKAGVAFKKSDKRLGIYGSIAVSGLLTGGIGAVVLAGYYFLTSERFRRDMFLLAVFGIGAFFTIITSVATFIVTQLLIFLISLILFTAFVLMITRNSAYLLPTAEPIPVAGETQHPPPDQPPPGELPPDCPNGPTGWPVNVAANMIQGPDGPFSHIGDEAMDIVVNTGTPVIATNGGRVELDNKTAEGLMVRVYSDCIGLPYYTAYLHMSTRSVTTGQIITAGTQIGQSGATGKVTGPHLHYEMLRRPDVRTGPPFANDPYLAPPYTPKYVTRECATVSDCKFTLP